MNPMQIPWQLEGVVPSGTLEVEIDPDWEPERIAGVIEEALAEHLVLVQKQQSLAWVPEVPDVD